MKREDVYYIGKHIHSFRPNVPGKIIGVEMITPDSSNGGLLEPRLCYHVQYSDKAEDFKPIDDKDNHEIKTFSELFKT